MSTALHLRHLITEYETVSGLLVGSMVALVTAESSEEALAHATAVAELSEGANIALTLLREFARGPGCVGHDWLVETMEPDDEVPSGQTTSPYRESAPVPVPRLECVNDGDHSEWIDDYGYNFAPCCGENLRVSPPVGTQE